MSFRGFLFDYNGVLVDDERVHWAAFLDVLGPMGIDISESEYWERYLGFDDAGAFRAILSNRGRDAAKSTVEQLVNAKRPRYLERARLELRAFEGAPELVRSLSERGALMGIVSGALRDEIALGLGTLGIADCMSFVIAAEDTPQSKPDPECYREGYRRLSALVDSLQRDECLVVEDSLSGIESALGAGLPCLAVAQSYPDDELRRAGAMAVVERIGDITPELLDTLAQGVHG